MAVTPTSSMVLIAPKGKKFATISDEQFDTWMDYPVSDVRPKETDPSAICEWMFNAKEIKVVWHVDDTDDPSPPDETFNYYHRGGNGQHPLPENYVFADVDGKEQIFNPCVHGDSQDGLWLDGDGNPSNHFFYVFIYHDKWYWLPGIEGDPQNLPHGDDIHITALGMKSYTQTVKHHKSDGSLSTTTKITTTITRQYYPTNSSP